MSPVLEVDDTEIRGKLLWATLLCNANYRPARTKERECLHRNEARK